MGTPAYIRLMAGLVLLIALGILETTNAGAVGNRPSGHLGKEFIAGCLKNHGKNKLAEFDVYITAYHGGTIVSITAINPNIHKEFHVKKGETLLIPVSRRLEMKDTGVYDSSVVIKSNKVISAVALNTVEDSSDTTVLLPLNELGTKYYVVTPPSGPEDAWKEFYVAAYKDAAKVDIVVKGPVTFKEQNYAPGSTLTVIVKPLEILQILSKQDLTGTCIESTKPIAVITGNSCAGTAQLCGLVSEQLLPVSHWGSTFIAPPLNIDGQKDIVYVTAAQNTNLQYQLGGTPKSQDLVAGQVFPIEVSSGNPLFIASSSPVQVLYYSSGGKDGDKAFSPFLTSVSDINKYGTAYKILGLPKFETNSAILIAKSASASEITMDKNPLSNVQWNPVPGSEFSWGRLELGPDFSCHKLDHGQVQFGLLSIGYSDSRAYGSSGVRISAPESTTPYIPTPSTQPTGPLGLQFIISFLQNNNQKGATRYQLLITAYFPSTTVSVEVTQSNFQKEFTVEEGETISVPISKPVGLQGSDTSFSSIVVKSDKVISVISQNFKDNSGGIELDLPDNKLGLEYYVVTPPVGPAGEKKEFSITNHRDKNKIDIILTGSAILQGQNYGAGSTVTVYLEPKQVLQMQSDENLSGTRILATSLMRVSSGHSCSGQEKACNHVSQQLQPVSQWGSRFVVPSLNLNGGKNSQLFVVASKKTRLEYQLGENKETKDLNAGQVHQIDLTGDSIYITAKCGIQVLHYNPGGKVGEQTYYPFFMDIPDISQFGTSYKILGQSNFDDNFAVFLAKTSSIPEITFDDAPLPNLQWKPISNTDYSWAQFNYGSGFGCHRVDHPDVPFGLLSYGYGDERAYASQAIRIVGPPPPKPLELVGTYPLSYLGKEFIIAAPKNAKNTPTWLEIQITASLDFTTVYVYFDVLGFYKVFTLQKGETTSFKIQMTDEIIGFNSFGYSLIIRSNNVISVLSTDTNGNRVDPVRVLPLNQLGLEYYVVSRPKGSANEYNQFYVANCETPNTIDIYLTFPASFQGKNYPAGSTFNVNLEPYQSLQIQSQDDMSGTRIVGKHPVAVVCGHGLSEEGTTSYQVSTQLLPVSRWGKTFVIPDYTLQNIYGVVMVIAYQTTNIHYQIGTKTESKTLNAGQVIVIETGEPGPMYFSSDAAVQLFYFNNGGTDGGQTVKPSLLQILDTTKFDTSYMISSNTNFDELTLYIVILTSAVLELSFDVSPTKNIQWTSIPGTDYSWVKYNIPNSPIINSIRHPHVPFALTIGQTNQLSTFISPAVPTSSIQTSGPLGKDFIIAIPHNENQDVPTKLEITITSYYQANTIFVTFEKANFRQEITLGKRETGTITINIPKELLGMTTFTYSIIISSVYEISVVFATYRGNNVETSQSLPVHELGTEFYVVTPSIDSDGSNKEFSITNHHSPNTIEIHPTADVNFNGQDYPAGSTITITLEPSQGCYVQSKGDLTGTKILSTSLIAVECGSSPSAANPTGHPISIQLLPVSKWGSSFIIPGMAETDHSDIVYVISPQDTDLEYQVANARKSHKMLAGEVVKIDVNSGAVFTSGTGLQIIYFSLGYDQGGRKFAPYAINVPEVSKFGTTFQIPGDINYDKNYAYFTVKTSEVPQLTFDRKPVENTKWEPIPGTDYSWGKFEYGSGPDNHVATLPSYPFGVTLVRYSKDSASSSPGTCTSALEFIQNPVEETFTNLSGTEPLILVGKQFIVSSPKSKDQAPISMEFRITANYDNTLVTISGDQIKFLREITLNQGQTSTITITFPAESLTSGTASFSIHITSNNIISVVTITHEGNKVKTADVFPVHLLGNEYFLVTLPGEKEVTREISVANNENPTQVDIYPTGNMEFEGQKYPAGSKITKTLGPFQGIVLQSNDGLLGTRIASTYPVSIVSGTTQLLPTIHWGKTFIVPPLSSPASSGIVFIVASQPTKIRYQLGPSRHKEKLVPGQVVQVEMTRHTPLYITANKGVQVMFYSNGEKTEGGLARPYIVNIYDITKYGTSYTVTVNDKAKKNLAILTAEVPEADKITWDGKPISVGWKPIPGTQFVVAEKDLGNEPGTHTVKSPGSAFGLHVIEFTDEETLVCPGTATSELQPSGPIGTEFIVPCPYNTNQDEPTSVDLQITAFYAQTTVTIILDKANFGKEITLGKGETGTVSITIPKDMLGDVPFTYSIIIKANKQITVEPVTHRGKQVETKESLPFHELGVEYIVITPTGQPTGGYKHFSVANYDAPNTVAIEVNADVEFQGQPYKKGSKLTLNLEPYQAAFIRSKDPLDGSRIEATHPVAVDNGYSSPDKGTDYHVATTQFLPVSHWGSTFLVPSLAPEKQHDMVYVTANTHTLVEYQSGGIRKREVLEPKQSITIELPSQKTLAITASSPVQALYYSPGGEHEGRTYDGYLFKIPDVKKYGTTYTINDSPTLDKKYAFFTTTTPTAPQITFDKEPVSNVDWKPISGTEYFWGKLDYSDKPGSHVVEQDHKRLGLIVVGYGDHRVSVKPAAPTSVLEISESPSEEPAGGTPSSPVGKEFVIPSPKISDTKEPMRFEITITAYVDGTICTILLDQISFMKEVTLMKGQTATVTIVIPGELMATLTTNTVSVVVKSDQPISVVSGTFVGNNVETTEVVPLQQMGVEYFIVTPPGKSDDDNKEITIANFDRPTTVHITPTCVVDFQEKTYNPGSTITLTLEPLKVIQIQSKHNLSGSKVVTTNPVAVSSGYSSPEKVTPAYHVATQLRPVSLWGSSFVIPSMASEGSSDIVFVVASQPTKVDYKVGDTSQSKNLEPGQVLQIEMPESTTLDLTASDGVLVIYYGKGGKVGYQEFNPYFINIPDRKKRSTRYLIHTNPNYDSVAVLTVKTPEVSQVTLDGNPLPNVEWKQIPGSEYSTAKTDLGHEPGSHTIEGPKQPFGVYVIAMTKPNPDQLTGGEHPLNPAGTIFVIPTPRLTDIKELVRLVFSITAYRDPTSATILMDKINFKKEVTLKSRQTVTIEITIPADILTGSNPVVIKSNEKTTVAYSIFIGNGVETIEAVPVEQQGTVYYVVTPPGKSDDDNKVVSIINYDSPNKVKFYPTRDVEFQGHTYKPGSAIPITLEPFQVTQIQSKGDLSGSEIVATSRIGVTCGYSSPEKVTPPYQATTSLLPTTRWGTKFLFPSLAFPDSTDNVIVTAYKPTQLTYTVGENKQSQKLEPGQVALIKVPESSTVSVKTDYGVMVVYSFTGGKIGDTSYEPFIYTVPDATDYSIKYLINGNPNYEKTTAILTVKKPDVPQVTFDGRPLPKIEWQPISETEYSTGKFDIGNDPVSHTIQGPSSPFGLMVVGYPKQNPDLLTGGDHPARPAGKLFVVPTSQIPKTNEPVRFEFRITGYTDRTIVTVKGDLLKYQKEFPLMKGQTVTVSITIPQELLPMFKDNPPFIITADKQISLVTEFYVGSRVQIIEGVPLQQLGVKYYVVTPPGKSDDDEKVFSITNFRSPNKVDIRPTGAVYFQGRPYKPGSTITITLEPFQGISFQSQDDLSGSSVNSITPVAMSSGYTSSEKAKTPYQVTSTLKPTKHWGTSYIFQSMNFPGRRDTVYVIASQPTQLDYQVGPNKESQTLEPGQVVHIDIPESTTVSVRANHGVMLTYYCTGGDLSGQSYEPFIANIPDSRQYSPKYLINVNPNNEKNVAYLTVKTPDTSKLTLDGSPVSNLEWKPIPGTEYSTAQYDLGTEPGSHTLEVANSPFGLLIIGYPVESSELPGGGIPSTPVGKIFVIPSPKPFKPGEIVKLELRITAGEAQATVNIKFDAINFQKTITLVQGQTASFKLTIPAELLMGPNIKPVLIESDKKISVTTGTFIGDNVETTEVLPLQPGAEYYVVTPPGRSDNDNKEISLANFDSPNTVYILVTGSVKYQEQTYPKGSMITVNLKPFEELYLRSKNDLSGTRVKTEKPITISSGYSSPDTSTSSYRVSIPLRPDTRWGKIFLLPSLALQGSSDTVYVIASKPTQLEYQVGDNKQTQTLKPGDVVPIEVPESTTLSIHADQRVMVTYYCTGGKIGDKVYQPYLVNIPDSTHYGNKYSVIINPNFEKTIAILTVKNTDVPKITFDGQPITNAEWKQIPGTDYSSTKYDIGHEPGSHTLEGPRSPFGVMIIGYTKQAAPQEPEPKSGEMATGPPKKEFEIPGPKVVDENGPPLKLQYHITAYEDGTKVTLFYDIANFRRELTLSTGQTATIGITIPPAMLRRGSGTITIKGDKPISVSTGNTPPKPQIHPVQQEGGEYYIVTPQGNSEDNNKELTIVNGNKPNNVELYLTGTVEHEGTTYPAGSKISLNLSPSQMVHMQSKDDLSGTRVITTNAMALTSGYTCSGTVSPCYHVAMQLRPISQWGKIYYVPSMAFTGSTDTVIIVASQTTVVEYVVGGTKHSQTIKAGEVIKIDIEEFSSVFISCDQAVMVMYYCSGGKVGDRTYQPYLISITDADKFGNRYKVKGNPNVEKNIAVLTAKTSDVSKLTFDGKPMSNIQWYPITGIDYSWGKYEIGTEPVEHIIDLEDSMFGLMVIGYGRPILIGNKPA